jgi:hypothetical protein
MVSYARTESSATPLQKPPNSHLNSFSDPRKREMEAINVYVYS